MSFQFWLKLTVALSLLPITFVTVHSYRKGVIKELRAKLLRRKIITEMESLLPHVLSLGSEAQEDHFPLFRVRAKLEHLYTLSDVLLGEEKTRLGLFLGSLSTLFLMSEAGTALSSDAHDVVLQGQRVIHECKELGP